MMGMGKVKRIWACGLILAAVWAPGSVRAEGLFEASEAELTDKASATVGETNTGPKFNLNGHVKSGLFLGRNEAAEGVLQGSYGELDARGTLEKGEFGRAFIDLRVHAGETRGPENAALPDIREAWAETAAGPLVFRLGRQIIVWGRADSINPTNNVTPRNSVALSSEYDDTRLGNELLQGTAKLLPELSLTAVWVPRYRPDVLPLALVTLPGSVSIGEAVYPDEKLASGNWALRMDLSTGPIDGSVSYYKGYATLPGFASQLSAAGMTLIPTAYRMQVVGADFSTALGDYGLRGEAGYKQPDLSSADYGYVPAAQWQYVVGLDRTLSDWNVLVQYSGVYVRDFKALEAPVLSDPADPMAQMAYAARMADMKMTQLNRQFTGTQDQVSHAATAQLGWSGLAETLHVKLAGMYNFTTREFAINPSVAYDLADAMTLTVGGRDVDGPEESISRLVNRLMSSAYVELKCSF